MTGDQPQKDNRPSTKQPPHNGGSPANGPFPQDPTVCPNPPSPPPDAFPLRTHGAAVLTPAADPADPNNQCSTNERAEQGTLAPEPGMDQPDHPVDDPAGRCSLERR
ncbi:hypothetical protein GCM10023074_72550 [Microbispora amethystogenes]